jgi:putative peptidoglycan lipid II flippase
VRAGVVALVSNMVFNFALIALLFELWAPPPLKNLPWLQGIARQPGLHVGLAFASSLSNWLNCLQLWHYLKKAGVYRREAGWVRHWLRLGVACALMVAVLAGGLWLWPWQEWTAARIPARAWHLAVLGIAGGAAFLVGLIAAGFRMRDLHAS